MKFKCYDSWTHLPNSADELFKHSERESIFNSQAWFESLVTHALTEEQSMLLACVLEGDRMLSMLPLIKHVDGSLRSLSNHYSTRYSLLINDEARRDEISSCFADGLAKLSFSSLRLEPIDLDDVHLLSLSSALKAKRFQQHPSFRFYNWVHPLNGQTFSEYMADRPSSLRNTIARKQRMLQREHGYDIQLSVGENVDSLLSDYTRVYRKSWKTGEFFADFKPALVKRAAKLGWLRLAVLYAGEQPVAAQIWFVVHGKANIFRLAYDEAWKKYSPGSILTEHVMKHVIEEDRVFELDFLTGKERYKQDWMSECRERWSIRYVREVTQKNLFIRMFSRVTNSFLNRKES